MRSSAAVSVLFRPDYSHFKNCLSYIDYINRLYLIDNSSAPARLPSFLAAHPKVKYLHVPKNLGIAGALNLAARLSAEENLEWLLTMDQDGSFDPLMASMYFEGAERLARMTDAAVIAPSHLKRERPPGGDPFCFKEPETVMTSGNLVRLSAFHEAGGFDESLFIDTVDHDFCLRVKMRGLGIFQFEYIHLNHKLGEPFRAGKKTMQKTITTHEPRRMYWITRNNLRLWKLYGERFPAYIAHRRDFYFSKTLKNILLYEKKKLPKLFHALRGAVDYKLGRGGASGEIPLSGNPLAGAVPDLEKSWPASFQRRDFTPPRELTILTLFSGSRELLGGYLSALEDLKKPADTQLLFITNAADAAFYEHLKNRSADTLYYHGQPAEAAGDAGGTSAQIRKARFCARLYEFAKPHIKGRDLLILEHDVIPPPYALEALMETRIKRRADFVSAGIISRVTGEHQAWRLKRAGTVIARVPLARGPKRVLATGFGFLLTASGNFLAMPMTGKDPRYPFYGCDVNGGMWARSRGLRWFVDGAVRCGHLLESGEFAKQGALANTPLGPLAQLRSEERAP